MASRQVTMMLPVLALAPIAAFAADACSLLTAAGIENTLKRRLAK